MRRGLALAGGAATSLAVALGLLVGVRSMVALELSAVRGLLWLPVLPVDALGVRWSGWVVWPGALQSWAVDRMIVTLAALALAGALVALLNIFVLLAEAGAARRRELAVRAALGASPGVLAGLLLRDVRLLLTVGTPSGLLAGMAAGALVRVSWPGEVASAGWAAGLGSLAAAVAAATAVAVLAYLHVGWRVGRRVTLASILLSGGRASADRAETFRRRVLAAFQMGMAGAVTLGALALSLGIRQADTTLNRAPDTVAIRAVLPDGASDWTPVLARLGGIEGLEVATVASEGAILGLGVRDYATAECGACSRGGLPLPFWGARADHHAVGPGFFEAAGLRLAAGRVLDAGDGPDAPRVAVVDRTFASSSFQDGNPLGRRVRLGRDLDAWYDVVGIVDAAPPLGPGADERPRETVWVSALQHAPRSGHVLLRGRPDAIATALAGLDAMGISRGAARTLAEVARDAAAPLRWGAGVGFALALLTLLLALRGVHAMSLQVTRRRLHELATRRALGAGDGRILAHVLAGSARTAAGGAAIALFFGSLAVAYLRGVAGGVPSPGAGAYVVVAALLVGAALLASAKAGREALSVEPALALE